jgi:hypothetical protein
VTQEVKIKRSEQLSQHRSLFWPIVLISIGVIWLLGNLGVISSANVAVLFRLWPLILIIVGVELLIGRNSPTLSGAIGIGAVVLIVVLMLVGPSLGWASGAEVKTANFSEPVNDATSAQISLNLGVADSTISPLADSNNLITADVRYIGEVEWVAEGESEKFVSLSQVSEGNDAMFNLFGAGWFSQGDDLDWNIGLSPDVPVDLNIKGGVGQANLDLNELQVTALSVSSGVGQINVSLPSTSESYAAQISGGVGEMNVTIPAGPDVTLTISGGVGASTIVVPEGAGIRLDADSGVGGVNLPGDLQRTSSDDESFVGAHGTWETDNYAEADQQITITYEGGVGSLDIHY